MAEPDTSQAREMANPVYISPSDLKNSERFIKNTKHQSDY